VLNNPTNKPSRQADLRAAEPTHLAIADIKIGERFRKKVGDVSGLADSIAEVGLLHPVVVNHKRELIAGHRRLAAAKELKWESVPVHVVNLTNLLRGQIAENIQRIDFTPSEKVAICDQLLKRERKEAKARRLDGLKRGSKTPVGENFPNGEKGRALDKVAAVVNSSGRTYQKAKMVVEAAEREPDKYSRLKEHMDKTGKVSAAHRQLIVMRQVERIGREPIQMPDGRYAVIVIDPPWPISPHGKGAPPYPTMTVDQIKALPVAARAADDCALWLWATDEFLRVAFDVLDCWGFKYRKLVVWDKLRLGLGEPLRSRNEFCLLAVRGKPVFTRNPRTSTMIREKARQHSRKPDRFYDMVDMLCPSLWSLDWFARERRCMWEAYGIDADHFAGEAPS
jgi:N6-adenosine-specific RNA methylase IME4